MRYKQFILLLIFNAGFFVFGQTVKEKLSVAVDKFENDPQLDYAIFSLYIINAETGEVVYNKNENIGLATASCLKLVTSATAFDLLGSNYRFTTKIFHTGAISNGVLKGDLIIQGDGDPTLGSWRWEQTQSSKILQQITQSLSKNNIKQIEGSVILADGYQKNVTPSNWIWEDLGNYYGAPARMFNWRENQYDLHFATGKKLNENTKILEIDPPQPDVEIINEVVTGEEASGDNAYIYLPPFGNYGVVKGTLQPNESNYMVSGAMPNPSKVFAQLLQSQLSKSGIQFQKKILSTVESGQTVFNKVKVNLLDTILSPTLDKINYWFMKKSINLYGEAFLNKMGEKLNGAYSTKTGVKVIKDHWVKKGINQKTLNIYDGSGLSPANRVTTKTLVNILKYASKQKWYESYLEAFPNYNDMKLKSGTIGDVKGFSGYHTSKEGSSYIISFLVNNYNGSTKSLVNKMFRVLDELK
jgi:serine-type D-Ala-D-Ala carboxypeptidase/endopeptidase (penicillin-binding protein 4)